MSLTECYRALKPSAAVCMFFDWRQLPTTTDVIRHFNRICEPGGIILDPFAGSGSTWVAAQMDGYRWIGCELSSHYHQVAKERLNRYAELDS